MRDSSLSVETGLRVWKMGVQFPAGAVIGFFLFVTAFRPALELTQPPIQWVPGIILLGVKRLERKADHSPPSRANVKE